MPFSFPPDNAWQRLPVSEWTADHARHLLRRAGWAALPEDVDRALREGLDATLERLFPSDLPLMPKPRALARLEDAAPALIREAREKTGDDRLRAQRELQERERQALQELSVRWLEFAARPENAPAAKWVLFLSDVYVVSAEKVRNASLIFQHFDILAQHGMGKAPALTKAVSRSPAMVIYLDLNQSQRRAPNENFARELFELFVLGEGNYTERDIKEAARAFTGYRAQPIEGEFRYVALQHDPTPKTVFGATGSFTGDDVIDLAYQQKAADAFLPHEMAKFYLSDEPLPHEYLAAIGQGWRDRAHDLRWLAHQFFGSRLFFAPEFRGNFIKSPIHFYLGLVQDLQLDVAPLPRMNLNPLRQMGQWLFYPPNVRGWVGGHNWINSATITARRQLVEMLFTPINERALNADELVDLTAARSNGISNFTVTDAQLAPLLQLTPTAAATKLATDYLPTAAPTAVTADFEQFIESTADSKQHRRLVRRAVATLMQSPQYQLC
jgi:uncharacterized protein (DUF1800 family)